MDIVDDLSSTSRSRRRGGIDPAEACISLSLEVLLQWLIATALIQAIGITSRYTAWSIEPSDMPVEQR